MITLRPSALFKLVLQITVTYHEVFTVLTVNTFGLSLLQEAQPVANPDSAAATLTEETTPEKKEEVEEQKSEDKKDETTVSSTSESPEAADKEKAADDAASTPDKKKKEKTKMKWSFRSISFSRKDKSKPNVSKNEGKNGGVTKEPVIEVSESHSSKVVTINLVPRPETLLGRS